MEVKIDPSVVCRILCPHCEARSLPLLPEPHFIKEGFRKGIKVGTRRGLFLPYPLPIPIFPLLVPKKIYIFFWGQGGVFWSIGIGEGSLPSPLLAPKKYIYFLGGGGASQGRQEGVKIFKSNTKIGEAVSLTFQLTQHLRDEPLIIRLADYLGCGRISKNRESIYLDVTKFTDLTDKVLPLLQNHPIIGKNREILRIFVK